MEGRQGSLEQGVKLGPVETSRRVAPTAAVVWVRVARLEVPPAPLEEGGPQPRAAGQVPEGASTTWAEHPATAAVVQPVQPVQPVLLEAAGSRQVGGAARATRLPAVGALEEGELEGPEDRPALEEGGREGPEDRPALAEATYAATGFKILQRPVIVEQRMWRMHTVGVFARLNARTLPIAETAC